VFIDKGYLVARVEDVAKRAGLSKGAVYFYFESKRHLFVAFMEEEYERTYSFIEQVDQDDRPAEIKLLDLGQQYVKYFAGLKSPPRFFLMMCEQGIRDEEIRAKCQAVHTRFVEASTQVIAQGMAEGTFRDGNPQAIAEMLKATIDGFAGQAAIGMRPDPERLLGDGMQMILRGLLKDEVADP
jgi:AcrR family transcriptional regulator